MRPILLIWPYPIYSYPLFLGIAWGVAYNFCFKQIELKKDLKSILSKYLLGLFIAVWIGAKVFFLMFSYEFNVNVLSAFNFWLGGGFVFYGGLVAGIVYTIIFKQFSQKIDLDTLSSFIPGLSLAHGIGRIGCFFAGCCFGRNLHQEIVFFGLHFHQIPVQLFEMAFLFILYFYLKRKQLTSRGVEVLSSYILTYSTFRFFIEFYRGDKIRGEFVVFSSSQWVSIILVIFCFLWKKYRDKEKVY